jgi:hypothetical protein
VIPTDIRCVYIPFTHGPAAGAYARGMKTKIFSTMLALAIVSGGVVSSFACGLSPSVLAHAAVSPDGVTSSNAIVALRALGPDGLQQLLQTHATLLADGDRAGGRWQSVRAALDAVGGQRDCHASRLYWHTDFQQAKAAAAREGKPILSLRLLGRLDEELSCANSRFFRTTLYANEQIADYLRANFVLHWKSVRPVPRITIDMGDGRTIERTITGNSIHYVLDADGNVMDALPGLYGANAFLSALKQAGQTARRASSLGGAERRAFLENYHTTSLDQINQRWSTDILRVNASATALPGPVAGAAQAARPAAMAAMGMAFSKSMVERPVLRALVPRREALSQSMDDALWKQISELHTNDVALDSGALGLIRTKHRLQPAAASMGPKHASDKDSLRAMLDNLKRSIAEDTVRNEYLFHARIHEWLAAPGVNVMVDALNSRVYAELFLTPESDPWLGLASLTEFSAVENGGFRRSEASRAQ